ncbi:MAG: hypothetical protein O2973_02865 [Gemmatimonadetes bacterium]|nr:hypothetical protein [Gemmatimonadota bacterium]
MTSIRTESIEVRRTALVASMGPEPGPAVRELWYVLHGQAMRAVAFLGDCRAAEADDRLVIAPEALSRFYDGPITSRDAPVAAIWMTRDEREHEISDYVAYLDTVHATILDRFGGTSPPVTILGFSQGGSTAIRWAASGHVKAAHVIVWASSMPPEIDYAALYEKQGQPAFTYVCGTTDIYITPKVLDAQHAVLRAAGIPFRALAFKGGHRIDDDTLKQAARLAG